MRSPRIATTGATLPALLALVLATASGGNGDAGGADPADAPGTLLSYYIYRQGFTASPPNYGMGSTIAVVMTAMILAVTAYYLRITIRHGEVR